MSWVTWVQFQLGAEILCIPLAILRGTEPVSALTLVLLSCCSLYSFFSWIWSVTISRLVAVERVLTLNRNIRLPLRLIWSTWSLYGFTRRLGAAGVWWTRVT